MKENRIPVFELIFLIIGELTVSAIVAAIFLLIKKFTLSVVFGALLGSFVTVVNFIVLVVMTNRAIDKLLLERGDKEMTDEEAAEFAAKHQGGLAAAQKISYIARMFSIAATLILALLIGDTFNVIATVVPLLMLRPMLTVSQLVKAKLNK